MITEISQELIEVLGMLWDRSNESRHMNWPYHLKQVQGTKPQSLGALDVDTIYKERSLVLPKGHSRIQLIAGWQLYIDGLAGDLWQARAELANKNFLPRPNYKELLKVHPDAERQIYLMPTEVFPEAAAIFWSHGQCLALTLNHDGTATLGAACFYAHGKPSHLDASFAPPPVEPLSVFPHPCPESECIPDPEFAKIAKTGAKKHAKTLKALREAGD